MQLEKLNTKKPLRKAKKKDQNLAFILEKNEFGSAFEGTISEPCTAKISGKKKQQQKTQNHEGRLWQSLKLDSLFLLFFSLSFSLELLTLKLTKVHLTKNQPNGTSFQLGYGKKH
jgi:hypothetical protein